MTFGRTKAKVKMVRLVKTSLRERLKCDHVPLYRIELYAPGLDFFTIAGFPTLEEAKQYRRLVLKKYELRWKDQERN